MKVGLKLFRNNRQVLMKLESEEDTFQKYSQGGEL